MEVRYNMRKSITKTIFDITDVKLNRLQGDTKPSDENIEYSSVGGVYGCNHFIFNGIININNNQDDPEDIDQFEFSFTVKSKHIGKNKLDFADRVKKLFESKGLIYSLIFAQCSMLLNNHFEVTLDE